MNFLEKYRNFLIKLFGYQKIMKHYDVDFSRPWWVILTKEWLRGMGVFLIFGLIFVFIYLQPTVLAVAFESSDVWLLFTFLIFVRFFLTLLDLYFVNYQNSVFQLNIRESVSLAANKFFLTVDPIFHSTRESGKIISKINRGSSAFEIFLDTLTFRVLPFLVGFLTLFVLLIQKDFLLGLIGFLSVSIMVFWNILIQIYNDKAFTPEKVKASDDLKQSEIETLAQTNFVRSLFSSVGQLNLIQKKNKRVMVVEGSQWTASGLPFNFLILFYNFSVVLLVWRLIYLKDANLISLADGLALISTYLISTNLIFDAGRMAKDLSKSLQEIQDLFGFIRTFGSQSFPVLDSREDQKFIKILEKNKAQDKEIKICLKGLDFEYSQDGKVFKNHNLELQVSRNQKNKVFGIIGPSGKGKTTLMSILGGQLNPQRGEVLIDGVPIYKVSDILRKNLVAFQMQTATSLRGSLRYNLLFGLDIGVGERLAFPQEDHRGDEPASLLDRINGHRDTKQLHRISDIQVHNDNEIQIESEKQTPKIGDSGLLEGQTPKIKDFDPLEGVSSNLILYSDEDLIKVLKSVGLWNIFKEKDGLDTLIGEGGLNLSGGQRQRLNFAGLYLRAKFYKPSLILIDEPTSSLDEISEKAITKMILELGEIGLTIVVAHRLKTLEESVGILDFSDLEKKIDLKFYSHADLKSKSDYYLRLLNGEELLDE